MVDTTVADSETTIAVEDGSDSVPAQTTEEVTEGSEDSTETVTQPKDDKTSKRLKDTESALKEAQKQFHDMKAELAELKGEQKVLLAQKTAPSEEDRPDWLDKLPSQYENQFDAEQLSAIGNIFAQSRSDTVELLNARDEHWKGVVADMIGDAVNPDRAEYRSEVTELNKYDWFKQLKAKDQVEAAKSYRNAKPKGPGPKPPDTGPAGTGQRADSKPAQDAAVKAAKETAKAIFGTGANKDESVVTIREE